MQITKIVEFDAGHRVPNHKSKCKNIHGHRYRCEITLEGNVIDQPEVSDEGMVMDFGDVKLIANEFIDGELDHGFICYQGDTELWAFLKQQEMKIKVVPFIPTAENLAEFLFAELKTKFKDVYGTNLKLKRIRLYETPNSYAEFEE